MKYTDIPDSDLKKSEETEIAINQKHICSFEPHTIPNIEKTCTRIRMSNGDQFDVIQPPYEQWIVDVYTTENNY